MATQISEPFELNSKLPLDSRITFKTIADMKSCPYERLYDGIRVVVTDELTEFQYFAANTSDKTYGKWRPVTGKIIASASSTKNKSADTLKFLEDAISSDATITKVYDNETDSVKLNVEPAGLSELFTTDASISHLYDKKSDKIHIKAEAKGITGLFSTDSTLSIKYDDNSDTIKAKVEPKGLETIITTTPDLNFAYDAKTDTAKMNIESSGLTKHFSTDDSIDISYEKSTDTIKVTAQAKGINDLLSVDDSITKKYNETLDKVDLKVNAAGLENMIVSDGCITAKADTKTNKLELDIPAEGIASRISGNPTISAGYDRISDTVKIKVDPDGLTTILDSDDSVKIYHNTTSNKVEFSVQSKGLADLISSDDSITVTHDAVNSKVKFDISPEGLLDKFSTGTGVKAELDEDSGTIKLSSTGGSGSKVAINEGDETGYLIDKISFDPKSGLSAAYDSNTKTLRFSLDASEMTTHVCETFPLSACSSNHVKIISSSGGGYAAVGTQLSFTNKFEFREDTYFTFISSQGTINRGKIGIYEFDETTNQYNMLVSTDYFTAGTGKVKVKVHPFFAGRQMYPTRNYFFVLFVNGNEIGNVYLYGMNQNTLSLGNYQPAVNLRVAGNIYNMDYIPETLSNVQNGDSLFYARIDY